MLLRMEQNWKTPLAADFEITADGLRAGKMTFEGLAMIDEGRWSGYIGDTRLRLEYERGAAGALLPDTDNLYNAYVNDVMCGCARRGEVVNTAGFSTKTLALDMGGTRYECWPFSLGRKGYRYPVFKDSVQVAEFSKGCKVRDDLHAFDIAVAEVSDACAAVLLCCYAFCQSWWRPGPAAKRHTCYHIQGKTRCRSPWAYDEGFMGRVGGGRWAS